MLWPGNFAGSEFSGCIQKFPITTNNVIQCTVGLFFFTMFQVIIPSSFTQKNYNTFAIEQLTNLCNEE